MAAGGAARPVSSLGLSSMPARNVRPQRKASFISIPPSCVGLSLDVQ